MVGTEVIFLKKSSIQKEEKGTRTAIQQEIVAELIDQTAGLEEPERKEYEQKIIQKMKTGRRLTAEELNYLKVHNPELYRTAMRVENARKSLRTRLENCRSKKEVQQVVTVQMEVLHAMKNDPDREYMAAMVQREIGEFKRSSTYARLPLEEQQGKQRKRKVLSESESGEKELFYKEALYSRTQYQCERISKLVQI